MKTSVLLLASLLGFSQSVLAANCFEKMEQAALETAARATGSNDLQIKDSQDRYASWQVEYAKIVVSISGRTRTYEVVANPKDCHIMAVKRSK